MGQGRFSDPVIQAWIDEIAAKTLWGAIFHQNPLTNDPLASEVSGPSYTRPSCPMSRSAYNLLVSLDLLDWPSLPAGTHIAWAGAFDADVNGTLQFAAPLDVAVDLLSGGPFTLPAGELVAGLDVSTGP